MKLKTYWGKSHLPKGNIYIRYVCVCMLWDKNLIYFQIFMTQMKQLGNVKIEETSIYLIFLIQNKNLKVDLIKIFMTIHLVKKCD